MFVFEQLERIKRYTVLCKAIYILRFWCMSHWPRTNVHLFFFYQTNGWTQATKNIITNFSNRRLLSINEGEDRVQLAAERWRDCTLILIIPSTLGVNISAVAFVTLTFRIFPLNHRPLRYYVFWDHPGRIIKGEAISWKARISRIYGYIGVSSSCSKVYFAQGNCYGIG